MKRAIIESAAALIRWVRLLRYQHRRIVAFLVYGAVTTVGFVVAFLIRFDFRWQPAYTTTFLLSLPILLLIRQLANVGFRLSTGRWRFVGVPDLLRLTGAIATGSLGILLVSRFIPVEPALPMSVIAIEGLLSVTGIAGVWVSYRMAFETLRYRRSQNGRQERRVLILGAGESGYMLAREMLRGASDLRPVGFVDDDPHKWGTFLAGLNVIGSSDDLHTISRIYRLDEAILAVPHATPAQTRELVRKCEVARLPYRVLPSIREVFEGNVRMDQVREARIEDLLGREPVDLDLEDLAEDLSGGCVLITGAAGSIGSELSRQIARHRPETLVILDQAETELHYLQLELREKHPNLRIVILMRDVTDSSGIEALFRSYDFTHVFHAAAYKHVSMMETNIGAAIRNNLLGSHVIADAAGRYGSRKFVLVSTDKAVRPKSVMGASKRLAEIATLELQEHHPKTSFAAVRFGNVLGSNGSVIPIFRRQIAAGVPLTVTHPEVTRYFMTIAEAVQLILQASLLPEIRGHIAMLEMGEPVKIVDLAENLLRLSGVYDRRRIVFTGLRPGEKIHEELVAPEEETLETAIRKVRLVKSMSKSSQSVLEDLPRWASTLSLGADEDLIAPLRELFPSLDLQSDSAPRTSSRVPHGTPMAEIAV